LADISISSAGQSERKQKSHRHFAPVERTCSTPSSAGKCARSCPELRKPSVIFLDARARRPLCL